MMEDFKEQKVLHYKYIMTLLLFARNKMSKMTTVQKIKMKPGVKLTIVGDTHGQLADLFTIFHINGLPSETNWCVSKKKLQIRSCLLYSLKFTSVRYVIAPPEN